jgi:hypothetical protein
MVGDSGFVTGVHAPPDALTREIDPSGPVKRITPLVLQVPSRPGLYVSHKVCAGPPAAGIVFNFAAAKKPIDLPSGDQKGPLALSVFARAATAWSRWTANKVDYDRP